MVTSRVVIPTGKVWARIIPRTTISRLPAGIRRVEQESIAALEMWSCASPRWFVSSRRSVSCWRFSSSSGQGLHELRFQRLARGGDFGQQLFVGGQQVVDVAGSVVGAVRVFEIEVVIPGFDL